MGDRDLHLPEGEPAGAAVVLHPHPGMGGDRHHPLVVAIAEGLADAGLAALRIDLTDPDPAAAVAPLEQASRELLEETGTDRLVLVGYSWGSIATSLARPPQLTHRVLIAPPVSMLTLTEGGGVPTLVLVPVHDQFGPPDAVRDAMGEWPATTIEVVEGTDHFVAGAVARIADRTVSWLSGA